MKKIQKILYSITLASFIVTCSITAFAEGSDSTQAMMNGCLSVMEQIAEETVTVNKQVTDKVVHEVDEDYSGGSTLNPGNPTKKIILSKMTGTWQ